MTADFSASAPVVVIGGGVLGCSTLYHLACDGVSDAVLLERNKLTSGTTWHSAAQVRMLRSTRNLTELIRYSVDLYARLEEETGLHTGWTRTGSLSLATNSDRLVHIRRQEALARLFGVEAVSISPGEAKERWPLMRETDVIGAVWSKGDGRVSPSDLCAALAKGARARGARIFEDTAVTGIRTRQGRVCGVDTLEGTIRCDAVAICAGLWSRKVAAMGSATAPVWPCEHFYLLTRPVPGIRRNLPTLSDHDGHLYIRDEAGGLLIGCFEPEARSINPERFEEDGAFRLLAEDWEHFEPMMRNALHRIPALAEVEVRTLVNGPESFTPDGMFLLGETAETRGLFLGCGMNSVGVATGGGAGMALARCLQQGEPLTDLHEADPKRLPDCFNSARALAERVPEVLGRHYEIAYPGRQWTTCRDLRRMPLHDLLTVEGAHFGQYAGYERPLYFASRRAPRLSFGRPEWHAQVGREVLAASTGAAIFDQSSLGKIDIRGNAACAFLDRVCANRMDRAPGSVIYSTMLNERGGVESDLTAIRLSVDHFRLHVGTASHGRDLAWLRRQLGDRDDVIIEDVTDSFAILALMGPESGRIAADLGADALQVLEYFRAGEARLAGVPVTGARLSYVGEQGWEVTIAAADASRVFRSLRAAGAVPAGIFAQTSMRIEKGYRAYGHELDSDVTPVEVGLGFSVAWGKGFIGEDALIAAGGQNSAVRIASLVLHDMEAVPIGGEPVLMQGKIVGRTTSAAFGYRIEAPVALADFWDLTARAEDATVEIDIAGTLHSATVRLVPAFDPEGIRMRSAGNWRA